MRLDGMVFATGLGHFLNMKSQASASERATF